MAESQKNQTEKENIVELKTNIYLLSIIGEVEGHESLGERTKATRYEHILPALARAEEDKSIDGLLILLNTVGAEMDYAADWTQQYHYGAIRDNNTLMYNKLGADTGIATTVRSSFRLKSVSNPWSKNVPFVPRNPMNNDIR